MPRRLLGIFILLLASVSMVRAQGDAVLLTVGGEAVTRREFEYHLRTSVEKRTDVFLHTYARFKQKVQAAKEQRMDTLSVYRRQVEHYRQAQANQKRIVETGKHYRPSGREWIKLVHVTYPLEQHADKRKEQAGKHYIDSLYTALKQGFVHQGVVKELPWMQTRYLLKEWQAQLASLERNELSKPFYSPLGIHLVAWTDKMAGHPSGALHPVPDDEPFRLKGLEEGLLVAVWEARLQENVRCTELELDTWFKEHRMDYGWGKPHFHGAVIHCQSKKEAKAIRKYLKKYPESLWTEAWKRMPSEVSKASRMEVGLFAIGENPYVDKLVFKQGTFQVLPDYPHTWVLGKKLKKGPSAYQDVRKKVEADCRKAKKKAEMEAVEGKYRVEINEEILKTVNNDGNK